MEVYLKYKTVRLVQWSAPVDERGSSIEYTPQPPISSRNFDYLAMVLFGSPSSPPCSTFLLMGQLLISPLLLIFGCEGLSICALPVWSVLGHVSSNFDEPEFSCTSMSLVGIKSLCNLFAGSLNSVGCNIFGTCSLACLDFSLGLRHIWNVFTNSFLYQG